MTDAARMARIARAQRALAEVAKGRAALAQRAHADSEAEADEIVAALNSDSPLHGIMVPTMASALRRNGVATVRLKGEAERAAAQQRREEVAADVLDERARDARRAERAAAERRLVEEIGAAWKPRR